jgi:alkylated DNA repair dioxygenase AlkB
LPSSASGFDYVAEFISVDEERALLAQIARLSFRNAHYKEYTAKRRVVVYDQAPPAFLLPLRDKVSGWLGIPARQFPHALVSEYRPGTGVGWHRDMPDFALVAGISLASPARMRFRPYPPEKAGRREIRALELEPRSAYVLRDDVRWKWQHSIAPTPALRYSVTFRTLLDERLRGRY